MPQVSKESASQLVVNYLKKQKKTNEINVATVQEENGGYIIRGITPVNIEGNNWPERFTVHVDKKGKVKTTDYALI